MTTSKVWRLSWVAILVVSAFFLGRHLKPDTRQAQGAPALNFAAPPPAASPGLGAPQRMPPPVRRPGNPPNQGGWR